jgi:hypothetical protein
MNELNFYKNKTNNMDGFNPYCKPCTKLKSVKWQEDNPEQYRENIRWRNSTENKNFVIANRALSKKKRLEGKHEEYRKKNPDKFKQYSENRKAKEHNISNKEWERCKKYFNHSCAYCGLSESEHKVIVGQQLHREHVNHEGANDLSNCIPSCRDCNSRKWKFTIEEWYCPDNETFTKERLQTIMNWLEGDYEKEYIYIY